MKQNDNLDTFSRRNVIKAGGAISTSTVLITGNAAGRGFGDEPGVVEWDGHGDEFAEFDCPGEAHWHWVLTPGGPNPIDVDSATLFVEFKDGTELDADGYRNGYGTNGAVHFDIFRDGGGTIKNAWAEFDGGSERSLLTISDAKCEREFLDYWQVDLIYGEPIEDFGDGPDDPDRTSYNAENRLLQALWYPGDSDDLEDFFDENDDEYKHCNVTIVENITYHPGSETATATIHIGNYEECGPDDFNLVSHDSEENRWWADEGAGQVLHDTGEYEEVDDNTYRYTVDVPN